MLEAYERWRDDVLELVEEFGASDLAVRAPDLTGQLHKQAERLADNRFRLVICAEWSNGKSTLINALVGQHILPTSVREWTAAITSIHYADEPGLTIVRRNGTEVQPDLAAKPLADWLDHYVTASSAEAPDLREVRIAYPVPLCQRGTVIVDTPGVHSIKESREEVTFEEIPNADAVLFIFDAAKAGSRSDLDFLRILGERTVGRVFFVLNRVDELAGERELEEAYEGLAAAMASLPASLRVARDHILPVSALYALKAREVLSGQQDLDALSREDRRFRWVRGAEDVQTMWEESRFSALEDRLSQFLESDERTRMSLLGPCRALRGTMQTRVVGSLGRELEALRDPDSLAELDEQVTQAADELDVVEGVRQDLAEWRRRRLRDVELELLNGPAGDGRKAAIRERMAALIDSHSVKQLRQDDGLVVKQALSEALAAARDEAAALLTAAANDVVVHTARELDRYRKRVDPFDISDDQVRADVSTDDIEELELDQLDALMGDGVLGMGGGALAGIALALVAPHLILPLLGIGAALGALGEWFVLGGSAKKKLKEGVDVVLDQVFPQIRSSALDARKGLVEQVEQWTRVTLETIESDARQRLDRIRAARQDEAEGIARTCAQLEAQITEAQDWILRVDELLAEIDPDGPEAP